jgi:hypothetical protein
LENRRKDLDWVSLAAKNSEKAVPAARFADFVKVRLESIRNYQTVSVGNPVNSGNGTALAGDIHKRREKDSNLRGR